MNMDLQQFTRHIPNSLIYGLTEGDLYFRKYIVVLAIQRMMTMRIAQKLQNYSITVEWKIILKLFLLPLQLIFTNGPPTPATPFPKLVIPAKAGIQSNNIFI